MQNPRPVRAEKKIRRNALFIAFFAIGPGVLGLAADNDAGGMLSYLVTGAAHHLGWFIGALLFMAPITYLVQELALRVAFATQAPYSQVIRRRFGMPISRINGMILHLLNLVILVTEFLGMAMGESLIGIPWKIAVILSFLIVMAITSWRQYQSVERLLLAIALVNLVFIPVALMLHPSPETWRIAFSGSYSPAVGFLMLSMAGNAMAPWMIYWQQNAVWAGNVRTLKTGRQDILIGVIAQGLMATVVLMIGALTLGHGSVIRNPLLWLARSQSPLVGDLFGLGIFNAGFLAACTISLSSAWMVRESWAPGEHPRHEMPTRGGLFVLHAITLGIAAIAATILPFGIGSVALWAQALGALWMPVSLIILGLIARDRYMMGPMAIRWRRQIVLLGIILLFIALAILGIKGS